MLYKTAMLTRLKTSAPMEGATITVPLSGTVRLVSGTGAFVAEISLLREINANGVAPGELTAVIDALEEQAETELLGDMLSYRTKHTGVSNTIFVSTKERMRHGPRIKIAIDPPDSLSPGCVNASIAIDSGEVVAGEEPKAIVLKQAREWIALNRDALLDYWHQRIDAADFNERIKPIKG
jgi:hypothetical protein